MVLYISMDVYTIWMCGVKYLIAPLCLIYTSHRVVAPPHSDLCWRFWTRLSS